MGSSPIITTKNNTMAMPIWNNMNLTQQAVDDFETEEETKLKERIIDAKFDIIILRELKLLSDKELVSLYKMIKSTDKENLVVAEEVIKQLFDSTNHEQKGNKSKDS